MTVPLSQLIEALSDPGFYPGSLRTVDVRQTHISVVFLAGESAYKIKKPVHLGFLDFRTLDQRHHDCAEEVRLNRRLAPGVYHGLVPICRQDGRLRLGWPGTIVDWAVWMRRLPEDATLLRRLERGEVPLDPLRALARLIARFHADASEQARAQPFGQFPVVAGNARENFSQTQDQIGRAVAPEVFARLRQLTDEQLDRLRPLIEARAAAGVPRETHGDLHLDHVYLFPDRTPPDDLVIIDCITFNERFRFADPVADLAFLIMDLRFRGWSDLAESLARAYFTARDDPRGWELLPFYVAYRALVRAKVEGMTLREAEVPAEERALGLRQARAHWLLALGALEAPERRPALILLTGLPGTGKSTLARALAERAGCAIVRSDVVRKELAGLPIDRPSPVEMRAALYARETTDAVYAACRDQAERHLLAGGRVILDATCGQRAQRRRFRELARSLAVPVLVLHGRTDEQTVRERLAGRARDASDADASVYLEARQRWEEPRDAQDIDMGGSPESALEAALAILRAHALLE